MILRADLCAAGICRRGYKCVVKRLNLFASHVCSANDQICCDISRVLCNSLSFTFT